MENKTNSLFSAAVIVAALGYFVDIYDLLLFGIIRVPSLSGHDGLGYTREQAMILGEEILSWQMMGLMIGGIIWGVMGDKKGRLSVLFGSILLYSLANIANGWVQNAEQYKIIRFIAGIGLAGELGAGITLVSEMVSREKRGIATSFVAGIGLTGAVVAFFIKEMFDWRTCYFIGGGLGLMLLLLRVSVMESKLYQQVSGHLVQRGNLLMLIRSKERLWRYVLSILIGLPTWLCIGLLVSFSDQFAQELGITGEVDPGRAIMYAYAAISLGDIQIGFLSRYLKSRKKALICYMGITLVFILLFFIPSVNATPFSMYLICAGIGFGTGFWAIFITMAAEQFGTNLRATAATTIPNMVRGLLAIFILPVFQELRNHVGYLHAGMLTSAIVMIISLMAIYFVKETYGRDLDFLEH